MSYLILIQKYIFDIGSLLTTYGDELLDLFSSLILIEDTHSARCYSDNVLFPINLVVLCLVSF